MNVIAKFECESVVNYEDTSNATKLSESISLRAVYDPNPESVNYTWSKYTPAGQLTMSISNPGVWGHFVVGKSYYLTVSEVADEA